MKLKLSEEIRLAQTVVWKDRYQDWADRAAELEADLHAISVDLGNAWRHGDVRRQAIKALETKIAELEKELAEAREIARVFVNIARCIPMAYVLEKIDADDVDWDEVAQSAIRQMKHSHQAPEEGDRETS